MSTLLFVVPDYVSHFYPLIPIIELALARGDSVSVATGPSLEPRVRELGARYERLLLGEESNAGLITRERERQIDQSLAATRKGWIVSLRAQAQERVGALLWRAEDTALETARLLERVRPDVTVVVQLAYGATAAIMALRAPFATFVTGHPAQLPDVGGLYGFPENLPPPLAEGTSAQRAELRNDCEAAQEEFTARFNAVMRSVVGSAVPIPNGLAAASDRLVLFNFPGRLVHTQPDATNRVFLGASVRRELPDPDLRNWLEHRTDGTPTVYFSFGSYFSVHSDVLAKVACALKSLKVRCAFACGLAERAKLGTLPSDWCVRPYFPQVAALPHCDVVVCHGGNNTVTEALWAGAALTIAPFASDQFWSANSIASHRLGTVFDPNTSSSSQIAASIERAITMKPTVVSLARELSLEPGPARALRALDEHFSGDT